MPSQIMNLQLQTPKNASGNGKDTDALSKEFSNKKRSRKAYTKKNKKAEESQQIKSAEINSVSEQNRYTAEAAPSHSVKFSAEVEEIGGMNEDSLEANNECTAMNDINVARLTNKKKQYLQDAI